MLAKERQNEMREIIRRDGKVTVAELARHFDVTPETVRRDFRILTKKDPIRRIRGGVMLLSPIQQEPDYEERKLKNRKEKRAIGMLAASLLSDGDTVSIDNGSTTAAFAEAIYGKKNLQIMTCSLEIALILCRKIKRGDFTGKVIMLGGTADPNLASVIGGDCFSARDRMHFNKAFFSVTAVSEKGVFIWDNVEAQFTAHVLSNAETRVCLAESEKFGKTSFFLCSEFGEIDRIVTDAAAPIPESVVSAIKQAGTELSIADLSSPCD